jgi:type II secretory pathway component PulF
MPRRPGISLGRSILFLALVVGTFVIALLLPIVRIVQMLT